MRQRITLLVAGTTSAIVLAFVIPLLMLTQSLAKDRAMVQLEAQSGTMSTAIAGIQSESELGSTVGKFTGPTMVVGLYGPGGEFYGSRPPGLTDADIAGCRAHASDCTVVRDGRVTALKPVLRSGQPFMMAASIPESELSRDLEASWATLIGLGLLLITISMLIARQFGARVARPVTDLAEVANRLRDGDLTVRATPDGPPETHQLGTAFNMLADRIGELVAAERESVADLGHRLRTPVTALRLDCDLITDPGVADRLRSHVDHLHRQIDAVVREARRNTRDSLVAETCDVSAVLADRAEFWEPLAEDQERSLTVRGIDRPYTVRLSQEDVREMLDTLLDNVFAHTPEGAAIELSATASGGAVALTVADGGGGADESALVRGQSGAGSTGLGLDIVRRLAESAGGSMTMRPSELGGLAVDITLPLVA